MPPPKIIIYWSTGSLHERQQGFEPQDLDDVHFKSYAKQIIKFGEIRQIHILKNLGKKYHKPEATIFIRAHKARKILHFLELALFKQKHTLF